MWWYITMRSHSSIWKKYYGCLFWRAPKRSVWWFDIVHWALLPVRQPKTMCPVMQNANHRLLFVWYQSYWNLQPFLALQHTSFVIFNGIMFLSDRHSLLHSTLSLLTKKTSLKFLVSKCPVAPWPMESFLATCTRLGTVGWKGHWWEEQQNCYLC